MLLACMMAEAGTPYLRPIASMFSSAPTTIGVPPSQVQWPTGAGTEPVTSDGR